MLFGTQHTKCNFIFPFFFPPGFKWQKQSDGLISSVCRSLAHLHVLPRVIFHGIFARGVNISKIETLFGEAGIRVGKNRERLPRRVNNVGSVSKCAQSGENDRDGHLTRLSVKQPKLYLEKKKRKKMVVSFVIHMYPF